VSKYIVIKAQKCLTDSDKAIMVRIAHHNVWIPKTQIHDDSDVHKAGTEGKLIISTWIAQEKGIEDEGEEYEP
jgi:hypothetical protein